MLTVEAGDDKLVNKFTWGGGRNQTHGPDSNSLTFLLYKESQEN